MLGATANPAVTPVDRVMRGVAADMGRSIEPTQVAVYFGEPGKTVPDPYFGGSGPERTGCIYCGGCMLGCRYGSKNSLDKNYLYFARKRGLELLADTEVTAVRALPGGGYRSRRAAAPACSASRRAASPRATSSSPAACSAPSSCCCA